MTGTQSSLGMDGWLDWMPRQPRPLAPGSAAYLGEAVPTAAPCTQEGGIYNPDLLPVVRSADEKVLSRN